MSWPAVTGQPGSRPVVFEDAGAPHQIVPGISGMRITVSCNCLAPVRSPRPRRQRPRTIITSRHGSFPADAMIAAWRAWHRKKGVVV